MNSPRPWAMRSRIPMGQRATACRFNWRTPMADLTITTTNVVAGANASTKQGIAGEALTAGQAIYQKAADLKLYKAKCSGTPEEATVKGIALNGAAVGQSVLYQSAGNMNIGAAATIKTTTYVLSAAYGG